MLLVINYCLIQYLCKYTLSLQLPLIQPLGFGLRQLVKILRFTKGIINLQFVVPYMMGLNLEALDIVDIYLRLIHLCVNIDMLRRSIKFTAVIFVCTFNVIC